MTKRLVEVPVAQNGDSRNGFHRNAPDYGSQGRHRDNTTAMPRRTQRGVKQPFKYAQPEANASMTPVASALLPHLDQDPRALRTQADIFSAHALQAETFQATKGDHVAAINAPGLKAAADAEAKKISAAQKWFNDLIPEDKVKVLAYKAKKAREEAQAATAAALFEIQEEALRRVLKATRERDDDAGRKGKK